MNRFALPALLAATLIPAFAVAQTGGLQPGLYRVTTTSPGQRAPTVNEDCLDADEVKRMFEVPPAGANCRTLRHVVAGGKIDVASTCASGSGAITGTYTPTSFAFNSRIQGRMGTTPIALNLQSRGVRIAACSADD